MTVSSEPGAKSAGTGRPSRSRAVRHARAGEDRGSDVDRADLHRAARRRALSKTTIRPRASGDRAWLSAASNTKTDLAPGGAFGPIRQQVRDRLHRAAPRARVVARDVAARQVDRREAVALRRRPRRTRIARDPVGVHAVARPREDGPILDHGRPRPRSGGPPPDREARNPGRGRDLPEREGAGGRRCETGALETSPERGSEPAQVPRRSRRAAAAPGASPRGRTRASDRTPWRLEETPVAIVVQISGGDSRSAGHHPVAPRASSSRIAAGACPGRRDRDRRSRSDDDRHRPRRGLRAPAPDRRSRREKNRRIATSSPSAAARREDPAIGARRGSVAGARERPRQEGRAARPPRASSAAMATGMPQSSARVESSRARPNVPAIHSAKTRRAAAASRRSSRRVRAPAPASAANAEPEARRAPPAADRPRRRGRRAPRTARADGEVRLPTSSTAATAASAAANAPSRIAGRKAPPRPSNTGRKSSRSTPRVEVAELAQPRARLARASGARARSRAAVPHDPREVREDRRRGARGASERLDAPRSSSSPTRPVRGLGARARWRSWRDARRGPCPCRCVSDRPPGRAGRR